MANKFSLFGFTISRGEDQQETQQSFTPPANDDGALTITSAAYYGTYVDLDGTAKNEVELISRYREMAMQPEIESAIDDIVNEAICQDDDGKIIQIILDDLEQPEKIKKAIKEEFHTVLRLLNYTNMAQDVFRRYYIDGKLFYHIIIDRENPTLGIRELRYVDPRKLRKIREVKKQKDERTGVEVVNTVNEYYIFNDKVTTGSSTNYGPVGTRITTDSIISVVSGLMDSRRAVVLSYLHKAIKPLNQLRMIEDATVIYRISRAPERRIFYIDVGNLPKLKAEQYLRDIMVKYKNKLVYDANTGEVRDDRKFLSMMEDFWLPRREGGKGTEITTLPGGQNLGELEDVKYFEKKLYKSLNVPVSRLDPNQSGFSLGRVGEITRDELKFAKFVGRMRAKFSDLFDQALRVQCVLKGICTNEEWNQFKEHIHYNFIKDNNFTELKEAELMTNRLQLLASVDPYTGRYFSQAWIQRNVLRLNDDEIAVMQEEIEEEKESGLGLPVGVTNNVAQQQMMSQIDQESAEQQNQLDNANENYKPTFGVIKKVISL
jgi:Bacteriophage T4-like portal protein (Gp20)